MVNEGSGQSDVVDRHVVHERLGPEIRAVGELERADLLAADAADRTAQVGAGDESASKVVSDQIALLLIPQFINERGGTGETASAVSPVAEALKQHGHPPGEKVRQPPPFSKVIPPRPLTMMSLLGARTTTPSSFARS